MIRIVACFVALLAPLSVLAQSDRPYFVGRIVSHTFLERLTNPWGTEYRVGIINSAASTGLMISPEDRRPVAKLMRGNGALLWASAAEQLDLPQRASFRFEVLSKIVDTESCPMLEEVHRNFYRELNRVLSEDIELSVLPVRPQVDTITVDGTTFPIQVYTGRNYFTVTADRDVSPELQRASYDLFGIVSACSNDVDGVIEEHMF